MRCDRSCGVGICGRMCAGGGGEGGGNKGLLKNKVKMNICKHDNRITILICKHCVM